MAQRDARIPIQKTAGTKKLAEATAECNRWSRRARPRHRQLVAHKAKLEPSERESVADRLLLLEAS